RFETELALDCLGDVLKIVGDIVARGLARLGRKPGTTFFQVDRDGEGTGIDERLGICVALNRVIGTRGDEYERLRWTARAFDLERPEYVALHGRMNGLRREGERQSG